MADSRLSWTGGVLVICGALLIESGVVTYSSTEATRWLLASIGTLVAVTGWSLLATKHPRHPR